MNKYTNMPKRETGKERAMQARLDAQHEANNSFVKKNQTELSRYAGKPPKLPEAAQKFDAYMCNNGTNAQEFARDLTKGMDKTAFPVK